MASNGSKEKTTTGKRRKWPIVVAVIVILALALAALRFFGVRRRALTSGPAETYAVERGDITVTLSGSGALQPADSYTITSLVSGDILTAPFEEGDTVGKDAVLYTVDSSDVEGGVQQAQNAVEQSQDAYEQALRQLDDLNLKAGGEGLVTALGVKAGDAVTAGETVAVVRDTGVMTLTVLFQREVSETFRIGGKAEIYTSSNSDVFGGVITKIGAVDVIPYNNVIAREVTMEVTNPGSFTASQTAYAKIGDEAGMQAGTLEYKYEGAVLATAAGKIDRINAAEGARVKKDQIIAVIHSDTVQSQVQKTKNALEDAKLTLDTQLNRAGDYTITSPIAGTIVEKDFKAGDTVKSGAVLCTVFDLSYLTLALNVDELDIKKVAAGQAVSITADAAPGEDFSGVVTKVNINGTTKNGVTSYPVTIKIADAEGLLPGMNVDAVIVVESLADVLTVPVAAVLRNNFVLLKSPDAGQQPAEPGIPEGFVYQEVTLGPSNDERIVVTAGLSEGDIVAVMDDTPSSYDTNPFMTRTQNRASQADSTGGAPAQGASDGGQTPAGAAS